MRTATTVLASLLLALPVTLVQASPLTGRNLLDVDGATGTTTYTDNGAALTTINVHGLLPSESYVLFDPWLVPSVEAKASATGDASFEAQRLIEGTYALLGSYGSYLEFTWRSASTAGYSAPCGIQVTLLSPRSVSSSQAKPCGVGVPPIDRELCPDGGYDCIRDKVDDIEVCPQGGYTCYVDDANAPCGTAGKPPCQDYLCDRPGFNGCNVEVCDGGGTACLQDYLNAGPCGGPNEPSCKDYACDRANDCDADPCPSMPDGDCDPDLPCSDTDKPSCQAYVCSINVLQDCNPPLPRLCSSGTYGLQPNCHTVALCDIDQGVGVKVDGSGSCTPVPKPCTGGTYGVQPSCHTIGVANCPGGVGVTVDGGIVASCIQTPVLCPADQVGAHVGGAGLCYPVPKPRLCSAGFGLEPDCHTVESCGGEQTGYRIDGSALTCFDQLSPCADGQRGIPPACVDEVGGIDGIGGVGDCRAGTSLYQGRYGVWCASAAEILQDSHPRGPVPFVFDEQNRSLLEKADALSDTGIRGAHPELPDPSEAGSPSVGPCSNGHGAVLGDKPFCASPPPTTPCPPRQLGANGACFSPPPAKILAILNETDYVSDEGSSSMSASASSTRDCSRTACDVVFIFGFTGLDGPESASYSNWNNMREYYLKRGYRSVSMLDYYGGACEPIQDPSSVAHMEHWGAHGYWMANHHTPRNGLGCNGQDVVVHDRNTDYRHMAFHVAQWLADTYGTTKIDIVAHSMGGLMVRYLMAMAAERDPHFPMLDVEDIVTMGTPHHGVYRAPCDHAGWTQTQQMSWCSSETEWLAEHAQNPQGLMGTDWTTMGSEDDEWVTTGSAGGMAALHKVKYCNDDGADAYRHTGYYQDVLNIRDHCAKWKDGNTGYSTWHDDAPAGAPRSVAWAFLASTRPDW
jgi:pimeloyl-ACP methyl ester carboxylesterase